MKCQWCKDPVDEPRMYAGKAYHRYCFDTLAAMARRVKGTL